MQTRVVVVHADREPMAGVVNPGPHQTYRNPRVGRGDPRTRGTAPGRDSRADDLRGAVRHGRPRRRDEPADRVHQVLGAGPDHREGPHPRARGGGQGARGRLARPARARRRGRHLRVDHRLPLLRRLPARPVQPVPARAPAGPGERRPLRRGRGPAVDADARRGRDGRQRRRAQGGGLRRAGRRRLRGLREHPRRGRRRGRGLRRGSHRRAGGDAQQGRLRGGARLRRGADRVPAGVRPALVRPRATTSRSSSPTRRRRSTC